MSNPEVVMPTPEEQLWEVAFACAEQQELLNEELNEQYVHLVGVDTRQLGLYAREVHTEKEGEYWALQAKIQELAQFEADLLATLERVATGTASDDEIEMFLPRQPEDQAEQGQYPSKRKQAILAEAAYIGIDPRRDLYGLLSWQILDKGSSGRLTTGRNRTRMVAKGKLGAVAAESLFFDQTADTHGGKVRANGKNGRRYTTKGGRRIRKY